MDIMLGNDFADSKIPVDRKELLEELTKNRTKHAVDYEEAYEGFKLAFVKEAEKILALGKEGDFSKSHVGLTPPKSHVKDYDRVIRMMEMCKVDQVIITEQQFSQYVLDEWGWQSEFSTSKALYAARGR